MTKASFFKRFMALLIDQLLFGAVFFWVFFGIPVLFLVYETILVSQWNGQTIGKKIMGIRVVKTDGSSVDWVKAFVRSLCRYLSSLALLLGYFWMLWDKDSQTWHDKLAETDVVEA